MISETNNKYNCFTFFKVLYTRERLSEPVSEVGMEQTSSNRHEELLASIENPSPGDGAHIEAARWITVLTSLVPEHNYHQICCLC